MAILKVSRKNINKIDIVNVDGGITASNIYKQYKPDILMNLALYDTETGINITLLKDEGVPSGYLFSDYGIGITEDKNIKWCKYTDSTDDYVSGSPVLVVNGQKNIQWGNKVSTYVNGNHYRTLFGFNDDEVILSATSKKMTIDESAKFMIDNGAKYAINCDGNGSCHLQQGDNVLVKSTRKNSTWLLIYLNKEVNEMPYIAIDPGHGANTAGKRSPDSSLMEYSFNQKVGKYLKEELERHGFKTLITCDGTTDVSLTERANIANKAGCDLYVSLHGNAYDEKWNSANGWECYVCAKGGNAEKLAKLLNRHCINELGLKDRGVKVSNFTVLTKTKMPAVLTENGFYTNKEECNKMKTEEFQKNCAIGHAKAICEYYGITYVENVAEKNNTTNNANVATWAKDAYDWVVENEISDGLRPTDTVTRQELWTMLHSYNTKIK